MLFAYDEVKTMFYLIFFKTTEGLLSSEQRHVALSEGRKAKIKLILWANPKKGEQNEEPIGAKKSKPTPLSAENTGDYATVGFISLAD